MTERQQINFFGKKNHNLWFFLIPLGIIVLLSVGVLIATTSYSVDYKIAEELAKGLKIEFGKYWSRFYEVLGTTELFILVIIYLTILLETWFLIKITNKKQKFKNNYWIVDTYYVVILIIWVAFNLTNLILIPKTDKGFGKGIDWLLMEDIKYKLVGSYLAFCYQTLLLCFGLYYVRYQLVQKNRLLREQSWLKAVKGLSFTGITYVLIIVLKGATGHLYYYNAIFGDLFAKLPAEAQEAYRNSGLKLGYGIDGSYIGNIPWELQYPWWKPNLGLIHSNANMPRFKLPWDYAFPSGHINATFCVGSGILLFLKNNNNEKVNWKVKLLFAVWIAHVLSMNFALVVQRWHWISDTAFTFVFSSMMILVVHFSCNKIFSKKINQY